MAEEKRKIFLTPEQAAKVLSVSLSTLKKFIYSGKLKTLKTPGGHHRILKKDLFVMAQSEESPFKSRMAELIPVSAIAEGLVRILEEKQRFCRGLSVVAAKLSIAIARKNNLDNTRVEDLYLAALLRNIGLFYLSDTVLNKPFPLDGQEYLEIKSHPLNGEKMANSIECFRGLSGIIRQHHERFDGSGYPDGSKGDMILEESRILAVADAFATMTAADSYKTTFTKEEAVEEIKRHSGTQFDPKIVSTFLEVINE